MGAQEQDSETGEREEPSTAQHGCAPIWELVAFVLPGSCGVCSWVLRGLFPARERSENTTVFKTGWVHPVCRFANFEKIILVFLIDRVYCPFVSPAPQDPGKTNVTSSQIGADHAALFSAPLTHRSHFPLPVLPPSAQSVSRRPPVSLFGTRSSTRRVPRVNATLTNRGSALLTLRAFRSRVTIRNQHLRQVGGGGKICIFSVTFTPCHRDPDRDSDDYG